MPSSSAIASIANDETGIANVDRLNLIGESQAFCAVMNFIRHVARCNAPVLIQGESGTGKELAAQAIHYLSDRRAGPFIPVNCGAIPDALIESELFGHERGAFTDAKQRCKGLIEAARGGTLFLDELETISSHGQVALLRFLQSQEYRPVGGTVVKRGDVRVISATNANLTELTSRGKFRQDLFFRITVLMLELPPLRARNDDVVLIAERLLERYCQQYRKSPKQLSSEAINALRDHTWPGNVRELENLVHREVLFEEAPLAEFWSLRSAQGHTGPQPELTAKSFREAKAAVIANFERAFIVELLQRANGNVSLAARLCGKERSRFGQLMRKHRIEPASFKDSAHTA